MRNNLEQYIKQNREAFDTEEPPAYNAARFAQPKRRSLYPFSKARVLTLLAAASVLIVLVMTTFDTPGKPSSKPTAFTDNQLPKKEVAKSVDPVLAKEVAHFSSVIENKRVQVKQIETEHPQLYEEFSRSVEQLDSIYHGLEAELSEATNQELLLEAMIQNLRLQTGLLSRQLEIIQKMKQKNKKHESKTI